MALSGRPPAGCRTLRARPSSSCGRPASAWARAAVRSASGVFPALLVLAFAMAGTAHAARKLAELADSVPRFNPLDGFAVYEGPFNLLGAGFENYYASVGAFHRAHSRMRGVPAVASAAA